MDPNITNTIVEIIKSDMKDSLDDFYHYRESYNITADQYFDIWESSYSFCIFENSDPNVNAQRSNMCDVAEAIDALHPNGSIYENSGQNFLPSFVNQKVNDLRTSFIAYLNIIPSAPRAAPAAFGRRMKRMRR